LASCEDGNGVLGTLQQTFHQSLAKKARSTQYKYLFHTLITPYKLVFIDQDFAKSSDIKVDEIMTVKGTERMKRA
jgi:hypothetical protein